MKILIVTQYFWPENFRINDLANELVSRGHNVTVLTGIPNYPIGRVFEAYQQDPKRYGHYAGATVRRVPMFTRGQGKVRLLLNYLSFVLGACLCGPWMLRGQKADVIFVFGPSPVTVGLPAVLIGRIKHAPVVFWALDLWPETLAAVGVVRSIKVLGWVGYLVKFIYDRCSLVLGQSRAFLGSIAKYCSETQKIHYFPSWAEEVYDEYDMVPAPEVPSCGEVFDILFTGNIGEAQDFTAVLAAAEILKYNAGIRWLIVGDGRKFDWLQNEVARRGLQDKVLLLGRFPLERMQSFYLHADALLVSLKKNPVFSKTIPGKIQSYLMTGVPLIGMLDGEGAQVITDANAGLVCAAGNFGGLATIVLEMASMSAKQRHQLGVNGQIYAQKEFDRDLLIGRLESLLNEAVSQHKKAK